MEAVSIYGEKFPKPSDPDQPKHLSNPRSLGESLWFGWVSEQWLYEDTSHLPQVTVHDATWGCCREFAVDAGGPVLDCRSTRPCIITADDGETFAIPRTVIGAPPPEDQYLAFLGLLETHRYNANYRNYHTPRWNLHYVSSSQMAGNLASFLVRNGGGYLFPEDEVSVGALVWAAQDAGIILEDRKHEYDQQLERDDRPRSGDVFLLVRNA